MTLFVNVFSKPERMARAVMSVAVPSATAPTEIAIINETNRFFEALPSVVLR
ncbi:MAG TPA: hypothetical protein VFO76_07725 [Candidatus Kapabacteria bacterium]|nr:hypothetical protein [Candidatus Kapabacteria bacterium]